MSFDGLALQMVQLEMRVLEAQLNRSMDDIYIYVSFIYICIYIYDIYICIETYISICI